ncbi:DUF3768 domain-containing protein [uncultured Roseobacter sp.]|uniref:DUF3768 domain-containing protein n=1 Tax=uncultured Roseobacter sp. TaxID=114847 RepID=UPI0026171323|nr:DUF3768 domain-containing protein [uncultured Roseobacter sp.]
MSDTDTHRIADQNDRFRRGDPAILGKILITPGIQALIQEARTEPATVFKIVQNFDTFTEDNDPYGTHEFGAFEFQSQKCYWKIDLYDLRFEFGSEAPADLTQTRRVLTILLASEW